MTQEPRRIGRYEVKAELGSGGMAAVYTAYDPRFKREVAIKVLPRQYRLDPLFRARFEREAQAIAAVEHPAIVPVYDFGEEDGQPYLVMRLMTGGSLVERIKAGPLTFTQAAAVISRLAPALDELHAHGIVHRDLKPANILFDQYGNAFLSDFGIAHLSQATTNLTGEALVGTPAYMAPEQARGEADLDGRADIYALGAILFEMLTGKQPYQATTPVAVALKHLTDPVPRILEARPDLPADTQELIDKAMAKDRQQRYASAVELADSQQRIFGGSTAGSGASATPPLTPAAAEQAALPGPPASQAEVSLQLHLESAPQSRREARHLESAIQKRREAKHQGSAARQRREAKRQEIAQAIAEAGQGVALARPEAGQAPGEARLPYPKRRLFALVPAAGLLLVLVLGGLCALGVVVYRLSLRHPANQPPIATLALPPAGLVVPEITQQAPLAGETAPPPSPTPLKVQPTGQAERLRPTPGLQLFQDDFSNPGSGWERFSDEGGSADYLSNAYRILVEKPHMLYFSTPNLNFKDVLIDVDADKVGGPDDNYFGVICRYQDADNFYLLTISSDGYYGIGKYKDGEFSYIGMDAMKLSSAIHQGKTANHLHAACVGSSLTLEANQVRLAAVNDRDFTSGDVGLAAATIKVGGTSILFDRFIAQVP